MAYVRMTEALKDTVMRKISHMNAAAIKPYKARLLDAAPQGVIDSFRENVERVVWRDGPEFKGRLPKAWLTEVTRFYVCVRFPALGETQGTRDVHVIYDFDVPIVRPLLLTAEQLHWLRVPAEDVDGAFREWVLHEYHTQAERDGIEARYSALRRQVISYLDAQPSLNRAIKETPELEMYVPEVYLDKLRESAPKRKAAAKDAAPTPEVDRDMLVALGAVHRLAGQ